MESARPAADRWTPGWPRKIPDSPTRKTPPPRTILDRPTRPAAPSRLRSNTPAEPLSRKSAPLDCTGAAPLDPRPRPVTPRDHKNIRARQRRHRLPQPVPRKRIERIHQHDIDVPIETPMLKPVVQNKVLDRRSRSSISRPTSARSAPIPTAASPDRRKICASSPVSVQAAGSPAAKIRFPEDCRRYPRVRIAGFDSFPAR